MRGTIYRTRQKSKDVAAWYSLGAAPLSKIYEAFDAFLKVVMLDREFREDAGRKVYFRF